MPDNEAKIKFFGLLKLNPSLNPAKYTDEIGVSIATLRKWKSQYFSSKTSEDIANAVNADELTVQRIAKETEEDIIEIIPEDMEVKPESIRKQITKVTDGIEGLQMLQGSMIEAADEIVATIQTRLDTLKSDTGSHVTREVSDLTDALTKLQSAFFNKNVTNVQVNQFGNGAEPMNAITAFRKQLTA